MLWRLVEMLLMTEVTTVVLLCLPFSVWRKMVIKCMPVFRNKNLKKAIMATQFLCGILFLDALNGVYRPHRQYFPDQARQQGEMARKFRAERNLHISGFCLLLLFLINRLMAFIVELEDCHKKVAIKSEQVQLLSDQLEARAAATAEERASHRRNQHEDVEGEERPSQRGLRHRATAATE